MENRHESTNMNRLLLAFCLSVSSSVLAEGAHHWGYAGHDGPDNWSRLSKQFADCGHGKNQSPVDIRDTVSAQLSPLQLDYDRGGFEVINNGHAIEMKYLPGSYLKIGGHPYELKQIHFHSSSEHQIEGRSFPLEAHFVHADARGQLAVMSVMFEEGKENAAIRQIWSSMPRKRGDRMSLKERISGKSLLPENSDYYRYNGSLTTPPCSEGVLWVVMKTPQKVSRQQIDELIAVMGHSNNRPVQPLNARVVLE